MKTRLLLLSVTALTLSTSVYGQGFNAGYKFTYHFDTLPLTGSGLSETYLQLTGFTGFGSRVAYELFEGLPTGAPVYSGRFGGVPYVTAPLGMWADLEGSFRITVLEGPVSFTGVFVRVAVPVSGITYDHYSLAVPVPEPGNLALMSMGLATVALLYRHRKGCRPLSPLV